MTKTGILPHVLILFIECTITFISWQVSLFALFCSEYQEMRLDASHQRFIVPQSYTYTKNFTIHTAENI